PVERTDVGGGLEPERHGDQRRNGVLRCLGQLLDVSPFCARRTDLVIRSKSRVIRTTSLELVVHTHFDHLGIAAPAHGGDCGRSSVSQLEIVVFELYRPVGLVPGFKSSAQKPPPAGILNNPDRHSAREGKRRAILRPPPPPRPP